MAWVPILDKNGIPIGWDYDDTNTQYGGISGVRTNSNGNQVYVSIRRAGEDLTGFANSDRGELSKTYWDNSKANVGQPPEDYSIGISFNDSQVSDLGGIYTKPITVNGSFNTTDPKSGNSSWKNNIGDYIDLNNHLNPANIVDEFTLVSWVRQDSGKTNTGSILDYGYRGNGSIQNVNYGLWFTVNASDGNIRYRIATNQTSGYGGGVGGLWYTNINVELNEWCFVAYTRNSISATAYVWTPTNGFEKETIIHNTGDLIFGTNNRKHGIGGFWLDVDPGSLNNTADGLGIDDIQLFTRDLSEQEIVGILNNGLA